MKTFLLTLTLILTISCNNKEQSIFDCESLIKIDSLDFSKNKKNAVNFLENSELEKENNEIKIQHLNKTFKDNLNEEFYMEYSIIGKIRNFNLIVGQDYNQNYYYLVSKNQIDTLVGPPQIFGKIILSIEDAYTDFQEKIEIWEIKENDKIELSNKFSLKKCYDYRIIESYLLDNYLFLRTGVENRKSDFYKVKFK